jgi:syringomycin synthetase protein SyrE
MYRTGDRGWQSVEGSLHFTGRIDRQIKLRGYRIELGEIEAVCLAIAGVQQAAAKLIDSTHPIAGKGKASIYVWIGTRKPLQTEDVQRQLRTLLPDYMMPSGISILPQLAESSTGKVDYAALPWQVAENDSAYPTSARVATALETELLGCWERVLKARPIRLHDNFFDLGGDSLAAVSILCDLEKRLGRKVPLYLLTEHPTIERLALAMGKDALPPCVIMRLTNRPSSLSPPLYLAASGHGDVLRFQNLALALGHAGDVYMLQPPMDRVLGSVAELAQMYALAIEQLGLAPGVVAGFSVGGIAALETARLLAQRRSGVRRLVLVDTIYPQSVLGGSTSWRVLGWLVRNLHIQELSMNGRRLGAMFNDPGLVGQVMALRAYHASAFDGPTVLIKSSGLASWDRWFFKPWRKLMAPRLTEHQVHGLHGSMFEADNVQALAGLLADIMRDEYAPTL